jgi:hypothetical protein
VGATAGERPAHLDRIIALQREPGRRSTLAIGKAFLRTEVPSSKVDHESNQLTIPRRHPFLTPRPVYAATAAVAALVLGGAVLFWTKPAPSRLLLAPMVGVTDRCIFAHSETRLPAGEWSTTCSGPQGSAGALLESTLSSLAPRGFTPPAYELGYTLQVPLLAMFKASGSDWIIDDAAVARVVRTIRDVRRPVILYLFSTHFAQNAPIEQVLQADARNIAETPNGPVPPDSYYGSRIFNWTFSSTDNDIARRRVQATQAVLAQVCKLEPAEIARVRGVTLLGELHHLFPGFQTGMGFTGPYLVSDYSEASKRGFRVFLQTKFGSVQALNSALGTGWTSFSQVDPPSRDIRTMPLRDFTEHIDSFAHGTFPVAGWVHVKAPREQSRQVIRVYRDGELLGVARVGLGRQDVLQSLPEFGVANTGWRLDVDFRSLPPGLHRIDVYLEDGQSALIHLATRKVAIMDRQQNTPGPALQKDLPPSRELPEGVRMSVDLPLDQSSYFYNPLVPLWHAFRGQQVVDYLESFGSVVRSSCLSKTRLYTHQIVPFTNPGWDENKYAAQASLGRLAGIQLGVSLYGEPTYGGSFTDWLATSGHENYAVTEFHPMKAMTPAELETALQLHSGKNADFVSFFLEPRWNGQLLSREHNLFSLDPDNRQFGSNVLYDSLREILASKP